MAHTKKKLTNAEIDEKLKEFFPNLTSSLCPGLCKEWETLFDQYESAVADGSKVLQQRALLLMKAVGAQLTAHKCECHPE
jgi:hypothetical protein